MSPPRRRPWWRRWRPGPRWWLAVVLGVLIGLFALAAVSASRGGDLRCGPDSRFRMGTCTTVTGQAP